MSEPAGRSLSVPLRRHVAAVAVVVATLGAAAPAMALFSRSRPVAGNVFTTGTVQPPSGLTLTAACAGVGLNYNVTVAWTASSSPTVVDYLVEWADNNLGTPGPWTVLAAPTASPAQQTGVARKAERWYRVRARTSTWSSTTVQALIVVPAKPC